MTPDEVIKKIISLGIEIFSITDHNAVFNCTAFEKTAREHEILFIPGIEIQTAEEIHLLSFFPDTVRLNDFYSAIVKPGMMQGMKNDPKRFGNQIKIDGSGEIIGEEEAMLSMPLIHSIDKLVDSIHDFDGLAVAAHLDRGFSLISQLGFIPPQLKIDAVEIRNVDRIDEMRSQYLEGMDLNVISSSDSHYIDMMKKPKMKFWMRDPTIERILGCLKGEGGGRITVGRGKSRPREIRGSKGPSNTGAARNDWKNLYGR